LDVSGLLFFNCFGKIVSVDMIYRELHGFCQVEVSFDFVEFVLYTF
jgi:hypothetical protein